MLTLTLKGTKYGKRRGARLKTDPQVIGERLEELRAVTGSITPPEVVEDARNPLSPLHEEFEWDDAVAAEQHRLHTAYLILTAIVVIPQDDNGDVVVAAEPVRAFWPVTEDGESHYTTTAIIMSDAELRRQLIEKALKEYEAWERRYRDLDELSEVFAAAAVAAIAVATEHAHARGAKHVKAEVAA